MENDNEWLVIVQAHRPDLYAALRPWLAGGAQVILDRRQSTIPRPDERRKPLTLEEAALWHALGFRVVRRAVAGAPKPGAPPIDAPSDPADPQTAACPAAREP